MDADTREKAIIYLILIHNGIKLKRDSSIFRDIVKNYSHISDITLMALCLGAKEQEDK